MTTAQIRDMSLKMGFSVEMGAEPLSPLFDAAIGPGGKMDVDLRNEGRTFHS
jgi:hypothetical protein